MLFGYFGYFFVNVAILAMTLLFLYVATILATKATFFVIVAILATNTKAAFCICGFFGY